MHQGQHVHLRVGPILTVQYALEGRLAQANFSMPPKQPSMVVGTECLMEMFLCLGRPSPCKTPTYSEPCSHVGMIQRSDLTTGLSVDDLVRSLDHICLAAETSTERSRRPRSPSKQISSQTRPQSPHDRPPLNEETTRRDQTARSVIRSMFCDVSDGFN